MADKMTDKMTKAQLGFVAEFAGHGHHGDGGGHAAHWWAGIPLFWIMFGFIGCMVLMVVGKKILAPILYKQEDYYKEDYKEEDDNE